MKYPVQEGLLGSIRTVLRRPIPPRSTGWITSMLIVAVLLFLQGASGVLLSVYYLPNPEAAADSVRYIMRDVEWGWLVRGMHAWGTTAIILVLAGQLAVGFLFGTYRGGRGASWVIGVVVLFLVLGLAFTGDLLVWDERSMALALAALEGTESVPLVGAPLATLMRGGAQVGVATLARAHAAHTLILPWLAFLLLLLDLWFRSRPDLGRLPSDGSLGSAGDGAEQSTGAVHDPSAQVGAR